MYVRPRECALFAPRNQESQMNYLDKIMAVGFAAISLQASAQQSPPSVTIPPHACEKPVGGPGVQPTYEQQKRFQKKIETYKDCINKYVGEMKRQADEYFEINKKYQEAGNAAINEYNAYVTEFNAQNVSGKESQGSAAQPSPPPAGGKKY